MESKIIHTSVSICESDTVIVATCEDGSVWTSSNFHSFEPFEKPFKVAQKKEEAPETIDNTTKAKIFAEMEAVANNGQVKYDMSQTILRWKRILSTLLENL